MPKTEAFDAYPDAYEVWFDRHAHAYASEVKAVQAVLPADGLGLEVGVGTGRFAARLGVRLGVEPSAPMRRLAEARGIHCVEGVAEALPFPGAAVNYVLMVTTLCFFDDVDRAFREVHRVLKPGGAFVLGFIDPESPLGQRYERHRAESRFYHEAHFSHARRSGAASPGDRFRRSALSPDDLR